MGDFENILKMFTRIFSDVCGKKLCSVKISMSPLIKNQL